MTLVDYKEQSAPVVVEGFLFDDPAARKVLDNFNTSSTQSSQLTFSKVIKTTETTTITESQSYSFSISMAAGVSASSIVGGIYAETSFTFGTSFLTELATSSSKEFESTVERTYELVAAPGTRVTAEIFYRELQYNFDWEGPTVCFFEYDPSIAVSGTSFKGTMGGSQSFPEGYVVLTEEYSGQTNENNDGDSKETNESKDGDSEEGGSIQGSDALQENLNSSGMVARGFAFLLASGSMILVTIL
jgi:hypothetical protein